MGGLTFDERAATRNALALAQLQSALDNRAEPEVNDELLTAEMAYGLALDNLAATPGVVAHWLHDECFEDQEPLDVYKLGGTLVRLERDLCVPELLAVLMCMSDRVALDALHMLRDKFYEALAGQAHAQARELLAAQYRQSAEV